QTSAQEIHVGITESAKKYPALRGMSSAIRVQHNRVADPKWRVNEMSNVDLLCGRDVVRVEFRRRTNIHQAKSGMSILDPLSELQRSYVVVLRLYGASE